MVYQENKAIPFGQLNILYRKDLFFYVQSFLSRFPCVWLVFRKTKLPRCNSLA